MTKLTSMFAPSFERFNRFVQSSPLLRWLFVTEDGEVVIGQMPNAPLIIAIVADVIAYAGRGQIRTFQTGPPRQPSSCGRYWRSVGA